MAQAGQDAGAPAGAGGQAEAAEIDRLLLAVAEGDRLALRRVHDLFAMKLVGIAARILGSRDEAEDVVQDVFVNIWQKAGSFRPGGASGTAWLVAIARNRAIDRLRAHGRRPAAAPEGAANEVADPDAAADRGAEAADAARFVSRALAGLDPRHAAVIRAAWLEGLSYGELSARFGVPVGTIKTWVFRGLRRMRAEAEG